MNTSILFDSAMNDEQRRVHLYGGDIFVFSGTPSTLALTGLAGEMLAAAFAPHDPRRIHEHKTPEEVAEILSKLKPQFIHHPKCKILLAADPRRARLRSRKDLLRCSADAFGLSAELPALGNRLRLPPASRHLVLRADVPAQLVDADLSARPRQLHGFLPALLQRAGPEQLGDLQLLRVEHQEPRDGRATRQSLEYLVSVIEEAMRSLRPGGAMFLGDLRSFPLTETFHASVQLFQADDSITRDQFWKRVQNSVREERELLIDPSIFAALRERIPAISRVEIQSKRGRAHNELTRFRYDAVLHLGGGEVSNVDCPWLEWKAERLSPCLAEGNSA